MSFGVRFRRTVLVAGASIVACAATALADPIETDRPDFTDSAVVVPWHRVQVEGGFTFEDARTAHTLGSPELLVRYGAWRRVELRLGAPDVVTLREGGLTTRGLGDMYAGAQWQLGPFANGLDCSVIAAASVPVGTRDFTSGSVDPEAELCVSRDLGRGFDLGSTLHGWWPRVDGARTTTLQSTLSLGRDLGGGWHAFLEYAGSFAGASPPQHLAHTGASLALGDDAQLDVHAGVSLDTGAPVDFFGAGFALRH